MFRPLTGYAFFVVSGGPKSANVNGSMGYVSYNRGWGETKNDFAFNTWYDAYHENIIQPFGDYCHELFRRSDLARILSVSLLTIP